MSAVAGSVSALLFDLDGTLLDSAAGLFAAAEAVLQEDEQDYDREQLQSIAATGSVRMLSSAYDLPRNAPEIPELRRRFLDHYQHLRQSDLLFPGSLELLNELSACGLPWGIVTNKPRAPSRQVVEQFPIFQRAHCFISAEDAPEIKPAPDGLLLACTQLQVDPAECIYVGDFDIDFYAARAAGMRVMLIDPKRHYCRLGADWLVESMAEGAGVLLDLIAAPEL